MDDLVEKTQENLPNKITIKAIREIVQTCLVNQINSSWVTETMKIMIDGEHALINGLTCPTIFKTELLIE